MTNYRNRIRALEYVNSSDLTPHPGNWREHPAAQAEALKGVLNEVGIAGALLAYRSERQGGALVVIDGHLRKDAAPQQWPVLVLDVDDAEADYLLATHDPLAAMATADAGALDALLSSVQSGDAAVTAMLAELAEDAGLYQPQDDPQDADPQIDRAEELRQVWGVEPGQLWRLPSRTPGQEHRLICGDCTDAAVVERVMGGEKADFCFTDPPYNVGKSYTEDTDDNKTQQDFILWCSGWLKHCPRPLLLTVGVKRLLWWEAITGAPDWTLAWIKRNGQSVTGFGGTNKWDPILCYGIKPDRDIDIVEVSNDYSENVKQSGSHPTAKPVKLWEYCIDRFGGKLIYEPFSGSGTTLIAAENLSRQCRAVEISPGYVAVALERYAMAFGIEPELIT